MTDAGFRPSLRSKRLPIGPTITRSTLAALLAFAIGTAGLGGCTSGREPEAGDAPDSGRAASGQVPARAPDTLAMLADRSRILGDSGAPLWVIIASDFECPFCQQWHAGSFHRLREEYVQTRKVKVAFVNFPLPRHANAFPAAEAAMCAGLQARFWEMHDAIFDSQSSWSGATDPWPRFTVLARQVGVSIDPWRSCVETHALRPLIEGDHARMRSAGVQSTPSFFVGNRVMAGAHPYDSLRTLIELELRSTPDSR